MPCTSSCSSGPQYSNLYQESEKKLCRTRWILLTLWELCKKTNVHIPLDFQQELSRERCEQLSHRRDDQGQVLRKLGYKLRDVKNNIEDIKKLGGVPGAGKLEEKQILEQRIVEINRLTDKDLLAGSWANPVSIIDRDLH